MNEITYAALGDVVQINPGISGEYRPPESLLVSFVPMAAVCEKDGVITRSEIRSFGDVSKGFTLFAENDVLFAKITPCMENGKAAIAKGLENGCGAGSTEFYVLRASDVLVPEFLYYFLRRSTFRAACKANYSGSAGQQRVPKSYLEKVMLPIPPLGEQQRLVSLMDRAWEIRRRADAARAKARAIIPALFNDAFGDPATNPKGWPKVDLDELVKKITGGKNLQAGDASGPFKIMKVSAVTSGVFRPEEAKPAPNDHLPAPEHHVREGDFLFSRANTSDLVGAVAIARNPPAGLLLPDKIWRIEWDRSQIEPEYAYSLLRSTELRRTFAIIASGTSDSMKNISQTKFLRIRVPVPPLPLQTSFASAAQRLETMVGHLDAAAAKAEAMAAALSAEVFSTPVAPTSAPERLDPVTA
jgi:type I restriction enzyme S subunit